MKRNRVTASLAIAATLFAGGTAFAAAGPTNAEYFPFPPTPTMANVHTSNGGAAMNGSTGTDAKTMGAQGTASPVDRTAEILMYLKAGG
jgi:hypothetical protein